MIIIKQLKVLSMVLVVTTLLNILLSAAQSVFAEGQSQQVNNFSLKDNNMSINSYNYLEDQSNVVVYHNYSNDVTQTQFVFDQGLNIDSTTTQNSNDLDVSYNESNRTLSVNWDLTVEGEQQITIYFGESLSTNSMLSANDYIASNLAKTTNLSIVNSGYTAPVANDSEEQITVDSEETAANQTANGNVSVLSVSPINESLNLNLDISPQKSLINTGETANFLMELKVTGAVKTYTNVQLVLQLPTVGTFNHPLAELEIAQQLPVYDAVARTLTYQFSELKTGQTYRTNLKIDTQNGVLLTGTTIEMSVSMQATEFAKITDNAIVILEADTSLSIVKEYFTTVNKAATDAPIREDIGVWKIRASIPKKTSGQMFLKEGSVITVIDTLPVNTTYISSSDAGVYNNANRTVTWTFTAPTLAQQAALANWLFEKELTVNLRFGTNLSNYATVTNTARINATNIANTALSTQSQASIILASDSGPVNNTSGDLYYGAHLGPLNGSDTLGTLENMNPYPTVYDTATLRFRSSLAYASHLNNITINGQTISNNNYHEDYVQDAIRSGFREANVHYTVNPNLVLKNIMLSKPIDHPSASSPILPLAHLPVTEVTLTVNGQVRAPIAIDYSQLDATNHVVLSRAALGLTPTDIVSKFKVTYKNTDPRMTVLEVMSNYTIKAGYTGTVTNRVYHDGVFNNGDRFKFEPVNDQSPLGGRSAIVAPPPVGSKPIATTTIGFLSTDGNIVKEGTNRVRVELKNAISSLRRMTGPFSAFALLPEGVQVAPLANANIAGSYQIIDNNYLGTNRQLVEFKWTDNELLSDELVFAELDVVIAESSPNTLSMNIYSYAENTPELSVPSVTNPTYSSTYLENNLNALNSRVGASHNRVRSGNEYQVLRSVNVQTDKLAKGNLDTSYSKMAHATVGGTIDYQLRLTNTSQTKIDKMTLIDVLPSVGDLSITDNANRGSKFTPTLLGGITLDSDWVNKVDVFYSTAKNPKRDDLMANVVYPANATAMQNPVSAVTPVWQLASAVTDWSTIHSFMIKLKTGVTWVTGENIVLDFQMKAPDGEELTDSTVLDQQIPENQRAAWNSFAFAMNNLQVVEPQRVGVVLMASLPTITKDVEGQQHYSLATRNQSFNWHVKTEFKDSTSSWSVATILDQINPLLEIQSITVKDQNGVNVLPNGTLTSVNNLISFVLYKKNNSFSYLSGQVYTMTIQTKIRADAGFEELEEFIAKGGIPNQASLNFGLVPTVIVSSIPLVVPPELVVLPDTGGSGIIGFMIIGSLLFFFGMIGYVSDANRRKDLANSMKKYVLMLMGLLLIGVGFGSFPTNVSAEGEADVINLYLHKLSFKVLPDDFLNNGWENPFDPDDVNLLKEYIRENGVEFATYDVTEQFFALRAQGLSQEEAQQQLASPDFDKTALTPIAIRRTARLNNIDGVALFQIPKKSGDRNAVYLITPTASQFVRRTGNLVLLLPLVGLLGQELTDVHLFPKSEYVRLADPTLTKEVSAPNANYGEELTYKVTVEIPDDIWVYTKFIVRDQADSSLLLNKNSLSILVDGQQITSSILDTNVAKSSFEVAFSPATMQELAGKTMEISYRMSIAKGATPDKELINKTRLETDLSTLEDEVMVDTGGAVFEKVDRKDNTITLSDAVFAIQNQAGQYLYEENGQYIWQTRDEQYEAYLVKLTSNQNGQFEIKGLKDGHYLLKELKAPSGYILSEEEIPFDIDYLTYSAAIEENVFYQVINEKQSSVDPPKNVDNGKPSSSKFLQSGEVKNISLFLIGIGLIMVVLYFKRKDISE